MRHVVRILGLADGSPHPAAGQWLITYNPYGREGRGHITTTEHRHLATRWKLDVFHTLYSTVVGTRPDGGLDRPLTAFNIEIERDE